jgi:hypothetical protein
VALNVNPAFDRDAPVSVDGVVAVPCDPASLASCTSAGTLSLAALASPLLISAKVDPRTIQSYPVGDRLTEETLALSFFTTAGRFDFPSGQATRAQPVAAVKLKNEQVAVGTTDALLWVVLRDLRGGQAVAGPYRLAVGP